MKYFYRLMIAVILTPIIVPCLWISLMFNRGQILAGFMVLGLFSFIWDRAKLD